MSQNRDPVAVSTIGIDTGKNTLHLIGLDERGTVVLREKVARGPERPSPSCSFGSWLIVMIPAEGSTLLTSPVITTSTWAKDRGCDAPKPAFLDGGYAEPHPVLKRRTVSSVWSPQNCRSCQRLGGHIPREAPLGARSIYSAFPSLEALRQQTRTIPIVFVVVADPIGQGFVASLAHPGGNITGFSSFDSLMAGKWLEMLTQITAPVARVAVLFNPATTPYAGLMLHAIDEAASSFSVAVRKAPVNSDSEVEAMMVGLAREMHGGVVVLPSVIATTHRDAIIALAAQYRLPAVYSFPFFAEGGGLMSYGVDVTDLHRRSATYVDHILKGDKPGDLPVQQPTKFDLVINLKTAKALDITIAPSLVATADEVIE
jgi:ABC-type uncharacterized transport system substrate-binding protein